MMWRSIARLDARGGLTCARDPPCRPARRARETGHPRGKRMAATDTPELAAFAPKRGTAGDNLPMWLGTRGHHGEPQRRDRRARLRPEAGDGRQGLGRSDLAQGLPWRRRAFEGLRPGSLSQEMAKIGAFSPIGGMGVMMFGPTLLEYKHRAQKQRFIAGIVNGTTRWCQGFSGTGRRVRPRLAGDAAAGQRATIIW